MRPFTRLRLDPSRRYKGMGCGAKNLKPRGVWCLLILCTRSEAIRGEVDLSLGPRYYHLLAVRGPCSDLLALRRVARGRRADSHRLARFPPCGSDLRVSVDLFARANGEAFGKDASYSRLHSSSAFWLRFRYRRPAHLRSIR